jgi:uncharacterized protein (TIGR03437 family)
VLNRLPLAALAVAVGAAIVPAKAGGPKVACDPGKITIESFDEGEAILDCFIGEEDHEPNLWITPSLQGILSAEVLSTEDVDGGTGFQVKVVLEEEDFGCARGGTIHFRGENGGTIAKPVPVGLKGECDDDGEGGESDDPEDIEDEELLESKVIYLLGDEEITELTHDDILEHDPIEITICAKCELADPQFWLTPNVAQYFDVEFDDVTDAETPEGEFKYLVTLTLKEDVDPETLSVQGTGHLKSVAPPRRTCPIPLKIRINTGEEETSEAAPGIVVGSADLKDGAVAPGEIVSVFGEGFGPSALQSFAIGPDGKLPDYLGEILVLFDGIPAPLLAAVDGQVNAIVPYEAAGRSHVEMYLIYKGSVSAPFLVAVKKASPALFTMDASGTGQGAILNQNMSVNSFLNPAIPGSIVSLYATGLGELTGDAETGALVGDELPTVSQPIKVYVGGVIAELLYAGGAPGLVNSVTQLNVRIPPNARSGTAVPVSVAAGDELSNGLVTLAIQ